MSTFAGTPPTVQKLSRGQVVSYALGDVANNLSFMMTSLFLMAYMTDIAGVSAAVAGTIYGVTKIWAGIADLIAGNTVDKAHPLRLAVSGDDPGLGRPLPPGRGPLDRLGRHRRPAGRRARAAVPGHHRGRLRLKFTITTLVLAAIAVVLYYVCFRNTREVVPRSPGKMKLATTLKMVAKNKPLLVLCLGAVFLLGAMFTMNAVMMFYAIYVLGSASNVIWLQIAQTVGTVIIASFVPLITVKLGKRIGYVALAVVAVVAYVIMANVPGGHGFAALVAIIAWFIYGWAWAAPTR